MTKLNQNENDKVLEIVNFYNKISPNLITEEETNIFIEDVINLSISTNEDISEILDICRDFAYRFIKISDICKFTKASILLRQSAGIE